MMGWWGRYLAPEVPLAAFSRERVLQQKCCAQMLVSSECIRSQPRALYTRLFHWIMTTPLPSAASGRLLEWAWEAVFLAKCGAA